MALTAAYQLGLVQRGESPADGKPMPDVGAGVTEIRLHGSEAVFSSFLDHENPTTRVEAEDKNAVPGKPA